MRCGWEVLPDHDYIYMNSWKQFGDWLAAQTSTRAANYPERARLLVTTAFTVTYVANPAK